MYVSPQQPTSRSFAALIVQRIQGEGQIEHRYTKVPLNHGRRYGESARMRYTQVLYSLHDKFSFLQIFLNFFLKIT